MQHQSLDVGYHPFNEVDIIQPNATILELFVPAKYFVDAPRRWSDMSHNFSSLRSTYLLLLELFHHISEQVSRTVLQDDKLYVPAQLAFFHVVRSEKDIHSPAGYRLRLMIQSPDLKKDDAGAIVMRLLADNKNATKVRQQEQTTGLHELTLDKYIRLCSIYTGNYYSSDRVSTVPLDDIDNVVHPYHVFSVPTSMRLAQHAGASRDDCNIINYQDESGVASSTLASGALRIYDFPSHQHVWRMKLCYLYRGAATKVYWPSVQVVNRSINRTQQQLYIQSMLGEGATDQQRREAELVYEQCVNRGDTTDETPDFETLKRDYAEEMKENAKIVDENERTAARLELRAKYMKHFASLFSGDSSTPRVIRAIARWMNDYVGQQASFCMPQRKITRNLTRFGDDMMGIMMELETLFGVISHHKEILCQLMKVFHVFACWGFNLHSVYYGPFSSGKSHIMKQVMQWMIENTYISLTYQSMKAFFANSNEYRFMNLFFEDVSPNMLGIQTNGRGGSDTANSDFESMMKATTTSDSLSSYTLDTSEGQAKRKTAETKTKTNFQFTMATNATKEDASKSFISRTDANSTPLKQRFDGVSSMSKINGELSPKVKEIQSAFVNRVRRNQAFSAVILLLVHVGILPNIDMTAANIVFEQVLLEAKKAGLSNWDDVRNFERLQMLCKMLVIWDAIGIVWDTSVLIRDRPHDLTHFLLVERYLRANVEHATFALGLLSHQYENRVIHSILNDLMETRFKAKKNKTKSTVTTTTVTNPPPISAEIDGLDARPEGVTTPRQISPKKPKKPRRGEPPPNQKKIDDWLKHETDKTAIRQDMNYYVCSFTDAITTGASVHRIDNNQGRMVALANNQINRMKERYLMNELVAAYRELMERVTVPDFYHTPQTDTEEQKMIPALKFENNEIYLSKDIVEKNKENALLTCTTKILDHVYATPAEYLYGNTRDRVPFMFDTIKVPTQLAKGSKRKQLIIHEPNYFNKKLLDIVSIHMDGAVSKRRRLNVDNEEEEYDDSTRVKWLHDLFAEKHSHIVDLDLNQFADELYLSKNKNISQNDLSRLLDGNPLTLRRQLVMQHDRSTHELIRYPIDIPQVLPQRYLKEQANHLSKYPDMYSLRSRLDKMNASTPEPESSNSKDEIAEHQLNQEEHNNNDDDAVLPQQDEDEDEEDMNEDDEEEEEDNDDEREEDNDLEDDDEEEEEEEEEVRNDTDESIATTTTTTTTTQNNNTNQRTEDYGDDEWQHQEAEYAELLASTKSSSNVSATTNNSNDDMQQETDLCNVPD